MTCATVYLVGAGPGDPGLATVRACELLRRADAVIYDSLASDRLLGLVPEQARLIDVGKRGFSAHVSQDEVNEILVQTAREVGESGGTCVVRLKGGDPFLFGRGGEEALVLVAEGIPFEVVPGVTSGIAAPAYAGIPVTQRGLASTVTFVTGHEDPSKETSAVDWHALARLVNAGGTLCFYMGMHNLGLIVERLDEEGVPRNTPVALVQWGTISSQRTVVSDLDSVVSSASDAGIGAPAIILVGSVAGLRDSLAWFEQRPLYGRTIVVTRAASQADEFSSCLEELGADVVKIPAIAFAEPDDITALRDAQRDAASYDWLVFTSANGVDAFFSGFAGDARKLADVLVAAIGPATARRLASYGIVADAVPERYRGEAVFEEMEKVARERGRTLSGSRVLIARAQVAREALPELLRDAGADVDVVAAYRTVVPDDSHIEPFVELLREGRVDGITFTSPSTVGNLSHMLGPDAGLIVNVKAFSIGPITSAALRELGVHDIVEASEYTCGGLIDAICASIDTGEQHEGSRRNRGLSAIQGNER